MSCCGFGSSFGGAGGASPDTGSTGVYSPPEVWGQNNVAAGQANVAMTALVSQNFDTIKMIRAGSIVGLATRLSTAILTGTLSVEVTKNGAGTGFLVAHLAGSSGGISTQDAGLTTYVAGDLIGMRLTANADFTPTTADLEAWLQLTEAL